MTRRSDSDHTPAVRDRGGRPIPAEARELIAAALRADVATEAGR